MELEVQVAKVTQSQNIRKRKHTTNYNFDIRFMNTLVWRGGGAENSI
jgi:hypothetical protein